MLNIKTLVLGCALFLCVSTPSWADLELIKDGQPLSEIVVEENALPQVQFAAKELQSHLEKISSAKLPIVNVPSDKVPHQIYVGDSKYTREAGVKTDDLVMEGYKIVANDNDLFLVGRDATFPRYPRNFKSPSDADALTKEWQDYVGEKWVLPRNGLYDPRNFSDELGFSVYDPTGTLFSVYAFLEQLGVRWYMPYGDHGTVIPSMKTISVPIGETAAAPVFSRRFMRWSFPSQDLPGFLWFKRQKLGMSEMVWYCHGTSYVTMLTADTHPEYRAETKGIPIRSKRDMGAPRLAAPLREAMVRFADKFFDKYPEMNTWPAAPADGFTNIDDRDAAAGWMREDRGQNGQLSDYAWTFVNDVAKEVAKEHPDKTVMGLAYGSAREVPNDIAKLSPNVGVAYCQTRSIRITPEARAQIVGERKAWREKMTSDEFYIWEYYLTHEDRNRLPGVPAIFTKLMQEDAQALRGVSKGEYVECSYGTNPNSMRNPALNHYPYMVQARLYWNPDLNIPAFLDEYCRLFYGPAQEEMKEFFTFAEEVWMRDEPRSIVDGNGFLKAPDVARFKDILQRAAAKAGDTVYGKRVATVAAECAPMMEIFQSQQLYTQATAALGEGKLEEASNLFQQAAKTAPDVGSRTDALYGWGEASKKSGNADEALKAWMELCKISPKAVPVPKRRMLHSARLSAANAFYKEKKYKEALQILDDYDIRNKDISAQLEVLKLAGDAAAGQGNKVKAKEKYRAALEIKGVPKNEASLIQSKLEGLDNKAAPSAQQ